MLEFDIPPYPVCAWRLPRYRLDGGPALPAVASGFPSLAAGVVRLMAPFLDCRKLACSYKYLHILAWFALSCALFEIGLGVLLWPYFHHYFIRHLLRDGVVLLALAAGSHLLAHLYFRRLAATLSRHCRERPDEDDSAERGFRHYDVTPQGVIARGGEGRPGE